MIKIIQIGKTVQNRPIFMRRVGTSKPNLLIIASVHAREHITTDLMNAIVDAYDGGGSFDYVPMLNADGVLKAKYGGDTLWKANANGVDLNVNFDADWGMGKSNTRTAGSENYIGEYPHSEPEAKAIVNLLKMNDYSLVVCYHSKGEEIYYGFADNFGHVEEASGFAAFLGYELKTSAGSAGGIKDFYCKNYKGLGLTVEVGEDRFDHPYPVSELPNLIKKHTGTIELLIEAGDRIARKIHGGGD